jgi:hypothetical protein
MPAMTVHSFSRGFPRDGSSLNLSSTTVAMASANSRLTQLMLAIRKKHHKWVLKSILKSIGTDSTYETDFL